MVRDRTARERAVPGIEWCRGPRRFCLFERQRLPSGLSSISRLAAPMAGCPLLFNGFAFTEGDEEWRYRCFLDLHARESSGRDHIH